jgi:Asp-tRNA(Asn)/Glu-tRNA(Gln) amidotransferase A subunit family amidase
VVAAATTAVALFRLMRFAHEANFLGLPAISIPVGFAHDGVSSGGKGGSDGERRLLPVGFQLLGRAWEEATLLRLAAALEHDIPLLLRAPSGADAAASFLRGFRLRPEVYYSLLSDDAAATEVAP